MQSFKWKRGRHKIILRPMQVFWRPFVFFQTLLQSVLPLSYNSTQIIEFNVCFYWNENGEGGRGNFTLPLPLKRGQILFTLYSGIHGRPLHCMPKKGSFKVVSNLVYLPSGSLNSFLCALLLLVGRFEGGARYVHVCMGTCYQRNFSFKRLWLGLFKTIFLSLPLRILSQFCLIG